jgi:hypothetical protein
MRLIGFAACVLVPIVLVACQTPPPPPPPSPVVTSSQLEVIRQQHAVSDPNWIIGQIGYVQSDQSLFTVVDIPAHSVAPDDIFSVLDANGNRIAVGEVVRVDPAGTMAAVHYEQQSATRGPTAGDVVIHVPIKP